MYFRCIISVHKIEIAKETVPSYAPLLSFQASGWEPYIKYLPCKDQMHNMVCYVYALQILCTAIAMVLLHFEGEKLYFLDIVTCVLRLILLYVFLLICKAVGVSDLYNTVRVANLICLKSYCSNPC
jgi:hypothetical protein